MLSLQTDIFTLMSQLYNVDCFAVFVEIRFQSADEHTIAWYAPSIILYHLKYCQYYVKQKDVSTWIWYV